MTPIKFPAKTWRAGNSQVITITKNICDMYGVKVGDSFNVVLEKVDSLKVSTKEDDTK